MIKSQTDLWMEISLRLDTTNLLIQKLLHSSNKLIKLIFWSDLKLHLLMQENQKLLKEWRFSNLQILTMELTRLIMEIDSMKMSNQLSVELLENQTEDIFKYLISQKLLRKIKLLWTKHWKDLRLQKNFDRRSDQKLKKRKDYLKFLVEKLVKILKINKIISKSIIKTTNLMNKKQKK